MPIYEYRCQSCGGVSSFFVRSIGVDLKPACQHCQSNEMQRRMSSFALGKTAASVHQSSPSDRAADRAAAGLDYYRDPRNIGRNVEESFSRHGVDIPQPVRESIDAAREGHIPQGIDI